MSTETPSTFPASSSAELVAASSATKSDESDSSLAMRSEREQPGDGPVLSVAIDSPLAGLPLQLDVTVPIPSFRVEDLLALEKGIVLESHWPPGEDVPVWCGGAQLAWTEFEVVDQKLAVRLTRIS